jgi:hypothetical protein
MTVRDLKEFLADKPEHYDVGIESVIGGDPNLIIIEGPSDTRWDCAFALLTKPQGSLYVKLA